MKSRYILAVMAFLIAPPAAGSTAEAQQRGRAESDEHRSRIDTTFAFNRDGVIDLSLVSGEIRVTAWNRNEVKVLATSERGLLRLDTSPSRVALSVRSDRGRLGDTNYELSVPAGVRIYAKAVSGDITVTGTGGEVEAGSVSGEVIVRNAGRRVNVSSVSGSVRAEQIQGDLRANSVSGDVDATDVSGEVTAETVSGEVTLRQIRSRFVRGESVSGTIQFDGVVESNGRYEFQSHSGDVRLGVPRQLGATVSVETYSGSVESDFPITVAPGTEVGRGRRFEFTVGDGSARIMARSFSGSIVLSNRGERR